MPLISLQQLKDFIHIKESYADTLLQDIIDGEMATVERMINQPLEETQETEYHDGEDDNTLLLKYGLVTAITSVKIDWDGDGTFEDELTEHEDYEWYDNGQIVLKSTVFPEGLKNIEVKYTHGYSFSTVSATNLPTDQGFQVFKDRPSFVAGGGYSGLDSVVLNTGPDGSGDTKTEGTDYTIMEHTGQVVALEAGSITDGDTLYVDGVKIRLTLVDTPESNEAGYREAAMFTRSICPVGSTALVDEDDGQTQKSYGRTIAVVYCGKHNLNKELLDSGHAEIYKRFCSVSEFSNEAWAYSYCRP